MRGLISILIVSSFVGACSPGQSERVLDQAAAGGWEAPDTVTYPVVIDGGSKIVYQLGHLTADKGLKLYHDTVHQPPGGFRLDDSVRKKLTGK